MQHANASYPQAALYIDDLLAPPPGRIGTDVAGEAFIYLSDPGTADATVKKLLKVYRNHPSFKPLFDALPDPKAVTALELKFKEAPIFVAEYQGQTLSFKKTPASDPAAFIAAELKRLAANP